ncbi:MAG: hypothetical protein HYU86_02430 [Chloroflexi bacterium]|nr:hypothetical protein [Chloroflexota bacterium]
MRGNSTQGFDPDNATGGADAYRFPNVYNSLTAVDPVGKSIPELAESWETPDPTTVVLKLKKGVKFHDGTDFNAQAVKFNYDRTLHPDQIGYPKFKSKAAQHLVAVKSYEVVDDYTFKIILKGPSGSFLYVGTGGQMASDAPGWMVSPAGVKKLDNDLLKQGVGTGPFEFVEWLMDERVSVKKFPGYWEKGIPYLDGIKWLVIPDSTTAMTMLKSGEVMWDNWFDFKDLETIKADPNLNLVLIPTAGTVTLTLNQKKPPFNNTALRQAVWYAIDRDAITKVVYKGTRPPAEAWFPSTSWAYDASLKGYPVDLDKARAKLKEGGKPDGFEFTIKIASAFPDWVQAAEIMQAMLAKVNIKTKVELVERAAMSTQRAEGNFEAESVGWSGDVEPAADLLGIHSKKSARGPFVLDGEDPVTKQVDALMDKGDSTFNLEERKAAYKEVQKLMLDQAYHRLILTYETSRHAHHKKVKGYVQYPGRFFSSYRPVWIQK